MRERRLGEDTGKRKRVPRGKRRALVLSGAALACVLALAVGFGVFGLGSGGQPMGEAGLNPMLLVHDGSMESDAAAQGEEESPATAEEAADSDSYTPDFGIPSVWDIPAEDIVAVDVEHDPDTVLVEVGQDCPLDQLNAALAQADGVHPVLVDADDVELGFVEVPVAAGVQPEQAIAQLQQLPGVLDVQPNFVYQLQEDWIPEEDIQDQAATGGDGTGDSSETETALHASDEDADAGEPLVTTIGDTGNADASQNLGINAVKLNDPDSSRQWMLESIHAYEAWSLKKTSKAVTVAVIDNGCLTAHQDLKGNIAATYNAVSGGTSVTPFNGHGTHVCGIIAAQAGNKQGVAGVSYNARLLPIQVFTSSGTTSADLKRAYDYILKNKSAYNIRVVNLSVGVARTDLTTTTASTLASQDRLLISSVEKAYDAGILTVCSSGNGADTLGGAYVNYPSDWLDCALGVIALKEGVSATSPIRASFSNYNMVNQRTKDIAAPGASIYSTFNRSTSDYATLSGTSMAAPCVAGVAALVFAANPQLTAKQAASILCSTATDLGSKGWDRFYGYGEVNAQKAVLKARTLTANSSTTKSLSNATISTVTAKTYTGSAIKPTPTVKLNGKTLKLNTDYTLSYQNNVNVGKASVIVKGKGAYSGVRSTTFTIQKASVASAAVTGISAKAYTGGKLYQNPTVKVAGRTLVRGADYSLVHKNNVKVGTATVTITGKGRYAGSITRTFSIVKAANPVKVNAAAKTVAYQNVRVKAQVVAPLSVSKAQGAVTYSKVSGSNALFVNAKTGKVTVKKGTKKGTYTLKVKVKAAGNGSYKPAVKTVTVKVTVK